MVKIREGLMVDAAAAQVFLGHLEDIYAEMDRGYAKAAAYYGFNCKGCSDNCCRTLFYHHTVLEYLYLIQGWADLGKEQRTATADRAASLCGLLPAVHAGSAPDDRMCPLNVDGRCLLYHRRPMICRLHGIPHELHAPGRPVYHGRGCDLFTAQYGAKAVFRFDRTPFYVKMARLEKDLRNALGVFEKIKMTVAQMIQRSCTGQ